MLRKQPPDYLSWVDQTGPVCALRHDLTNRPVHLEGLSKFSAETSGHSRVPLICRPSGVHKRGFKWPRH